MTWGFYILIAFGVIAASKEQDPNTSLMIHLLIGILWPATVAYQICMRLAKG